MLINIFEESPTNVSIVLSRAAETMAGKKATFKFEQEGGEADVEDAEIDIKGDEVRHEFDLPKCKDDEEYYDLTYMVEADETCYDGNKDFKVWPKTFTLKAVDAEKSEAIAGASVRIIQQGKEVLKARSGKDGTVEVHLAVADRATVEAISPWEIKEWVAEKGRAREAKFIRKPYKAEFVSPEFTGEEHKQYVNLSDNGKEQGHKIKFKIGAQGDARRAPEARLALKGDKLFVRVEFGEDNSKRNNPKPEAKGFDDGGAPRVFKKELEIEEDGGGAEFEVELGYAGGDECTVSIGVTDKCEDAKVKVTNWRKLFYQATFPEGGRVPSMATLNAALKEVFIEYEEFKRLQVDKGSGPGGVQFWFPGEWIGAAGKCLNVGDYNRTHFHNKFKSDKDPLGVHLLLCHTQYDCNGASTTKSFVKTVKKTDKTKWSDAKDVPGIKLRVGRGLFPKKMKDGTSSLISGSWAEKGGSKSGNIVEADLWVDVAKANRGYATIKLPEAAAKVCEAGGEVMVSVDLYCASGPYCGEAAGHKQLIAFQGFTDKAICDTIGHELGHTMNQVGGAAPPGLTAGDHGRAYTGNGHQGGHCADGMSDGNYAGGAGSGAYAGDFEGASECTCVMYGEDNSACTGKFCDRCKPFVKAEALTSL